MKLLKKHSLARLIFLRSACTIVAVSLACVTVTATVLYALFLDDAQENLRDELTYIAAGVEMAGEDYLEQLPLRQHIRITWIGADGQVLFETEADPALMDNHANRPEVLEALECGMGTAQRSSVTLDAWMIYRAIRIGDGSVVRLCLLESSPLFMLAQAALPLTLVLAAALVLAVASSASTVRKIVAPINHIDLKEPNPSAVYSELAPLTQRILAQNEQIHQNLQSIRAAHEEQDRFRQEFTANVSHELKTPLTSISGFAEIIRDGLVKPEDIPHFAGTIYNEAQRLILLVGDIIKISQMDDPKIPIQKEPVDLYDLTALILERLESLAKKSGVTLHLSGNHAQVIGSYQIADEMIHNLCDNAIKYNRPGGDVFVTIRPGQDCTELTVRDTGIGIPEAHRERVFERFYRVDKNRSRAIGGTGLGLSIVKHGAIFHGAKVQLESIPGEGTTITLRFPT